MRVVSGITSARGGGGKAAAVGQDTTNRGALLGILEHLSEHLGQSIAYARTNGVVPPWSAGN